MIKIISVWGLFYGGLLILAIYNVVLYAGAKEKSLLAYVGYISAVILWQFVWGGHIQFVFDGGMPLWIASHTEMIFIIIGLSSGIFTVSFLDAEKNAPSSYALIKIMLALQVLVGLACIVEILPHIWKNNLVYGVGAVSICTYVSAGIEAFYNRFRPARYFIIAWTMLAVGALIGMLSLMDIVPSNPFTTYCFQVGVFLEAGESNQYL